MQDKKFKQYSFNLITFIYKNFAESLIDEDEPIIVEIK